MRRVLSGLLLLWAAPAVAAGAFAPAAPLGSTVLDLDVKSGNYSTWRIDDASGINAIRTTLQIHRLGADDPRWAPAFTITLKNGDALVTFQIQSEHRQPPLSLHFEANRGDEEIDDQTFTFTLGLDEKLDVAIDWTADGTVSIKAGPEKRTIALGVPIKAVSFGASTGEVEFNPLQIGTSAP